MTRLVSITLCCIVFALRVHGSEYSLAISAAPAKPVFLVAEPIVFHIAVGNTGNQPLPNRWFVLDSNFRSSVKHAKNGDYVQNLCFEAPYGVPSRTCLDRTLKPGEFVETSIEILDGDPVHPSTYFLGQTLDRGEYRRGGGVLRSLVAGEYMSKVWHGVEDLVFDKSGKLLLDLRKADEEKDYATVAAVLQRRDRQYLDAETNILFQIREPEGPEKKAFDDYMKLWLAVVTNDLKTAEQALSSLGSHSSASTYYEWGLYYVARLALEKNALESSERIFSELKKRDKFPLSIEVEYWRLLAKKQQGKLRKDDPDLVALKEKTRNRLLLPQLVWKEKITRVQSLEKGLEKD